MAQKQVINMRQFAWLTGALLTGGGLVSVQNVIIRGARTDTWLSYLLPTLYAFVIIALFGFLSKTFPKKNIYDIIFEVFGKWAGGVLNAILLCHIWMILVRDISLFNRFFITTLLPRTPLEILTLLFLFVLIYFGSSNLEVIARVNDLFFPLFVLIIIIMPVALTNEIQASLMQPLMAAPIWRLLSASTIATSWYGDIFVMGAFLHMIFSSKELKAGLRRGVFLATFILTLTLLTEILVFGPYLPGNLIYPSYSLVQQVHITDFLDRVDLIMLMTLFPTTACRVVTIYLALLIGIASFTRKKEYSMLNKPVAAMLVAGSLIAFRSTTEVFSFGNYSSTAIFLAYQPIYIVLLYAGTKFHLRRRDNPGHPKQQEHRQTSQNNSGGNHSSGGQNRKIWDRISAKYPHSVWRMASNATLGSNVLAILLGYWLGPRWALAGNICGFLYGMGIVMLLLSTYAEVKTAPHQTV